MSRETYLQDELWKTNEPEGDDKKLTSTIRSKRRGTRKTTEILHKKSRLRCHPRLKRARRRRSVTFRGGEE